MAGVYIKAGEGDALNVLGPPPHRHDWDEAYTEFMPALKPAGP